MDLDTSPLGIPYPKPSAHRSRRLRKKLFLDEFQQLGFHVGYQFDPTLTREQAEVLWDRFIEEAIEGNGLVCGGGGTWHEAKYYVMGSHGRRFRELSVRPEQRQGVIDWLEANRGVGVVDYAVSELEDANYDAPE